MGRVIDCDTVKRSIAVYGPVLVLVLACGGAQNHATTESTAPVLVVKPFTLIDDNNILSVDNNGRVTLRSDGNTSHVGVVHADGRFVMPGGQLLVQMDASGKVHVPGLGNIEYHIAEDGRVTSGNKGSGLAFTNAGDIVVGDSEETIAQTTNVTPETRRTAAFTLIAAMIKKQQEKRGANHSALASHRTAARAVVDTLKAAHDTYMQTVVQHLRSKGSPMKFSPEFATEADIALPLPDTFIHQVSRRLHSAGASVRAELRSLWWFNRNAQPKNDWEKQALLEIVDNPSSQPERVIGTAPTQTYQTMLPISATNSACVDCHNALLKKRGSNKRLKRNDIIGGYLITLPHGD